MDTTWQSLIDRAYHLPPAEYSRGKHWRGKSEEERRRNSQNKRPSQFKSALTEDMVKHLERETLLTCDVVKSANGTYRAYKEFSELIGYDNGKDAYWLRVELTAADSDRPVIHSHPRFNNQE